MTLQVPSVRKDDWTRLRIIIDKLKHLSLGVNSHPTFAGLTLTKGPLDLTGKVIVGSQTSPVDVTVTRKYGFELHYSGNNYDVTGIRSRAQLVTTDTTATALGGLFQAANNDGINAGVLMGFMAEAIGKSTANASTITTMRGGLIGCEWGALDTITSLHGLHIRIHTLNNAGAGSFGTACAITIENEAVGGNGQCITSGIQFVGTNLSGGNCAFDYGINFGNGVNYNSADMNLSVGEIHRAGVRFLKEDNTNYNMFFGTETFNNDDGQYNVGVGYRAGYYNDTTGVGSEGDYNTYIGYRSGYGLFGPGFENTGYHNVGIGYNTLLYNISGYRNLAIGSEALQDNQTGHSNLAIGNAALYQNTTGNSNIAIGKSALWSLIDEDYNIAIGPACCYSTTGTSNIGIGANTLRSNVGGAYNVAIGRDALYDVVSGNDNTAIGNAAGIKCTGSDNIFIGYRAGYRQVAISNLLIVDNQLRADIATEITNCLLYGIMAATPADQSLRINGEILGSDGAKIGDVATNNTVFATDGLQTMVGTARVIRELWVDAGGIKAPGSKPATEVTHGLLETPAWSFSNEAVQANEQTISFNLKVPPDMDRSVAPTLCLGWSSTTTTGVVEWQLEYLYSQAGETTAAAAEETLYADDSVSGTAEGLVISIVSGINLPHANDVCIHCRVKRLSSATANGGAESDTLADSAEVHGVVFVYTSDKLGIAT